MGKFLEQARHNEALLDLLDEKFPDLFFDWKITIAFYSTLHYMNEYLADGGRNIIVHDHSERNAQLNPNDHRCTFPLSEDLWEKYYEIYIKSKAVRYQGIPNKRSVLLKWKEDYTTVRRYFKELKDFVLEDLNL